MALIDLRGKIPALKQLLILLLFTKGRKTEFPHTISDNDLQQFLRSKYQSYKSKIESASVFSERMGETINSINAILEERRENPELEPSFGAEFSDTRFKTETFADPNMDSESPFKLSFLPPQSLDGIFVMSPDGLYYDSQKGGLDPVALYLSGLELPPVGDLYKFEQAPNLGGRGLTISAKDLNTFKDTLFDIDVIDDSTTMLEHYRSDHFLQQLIGSRNKKINDLSGTLQAYDAAEESLAVITNLKHTINAEAGRFEELIRKRKKQIEVHVKVPYIFGQGTNVPRPDFGGGPANYTPFAAGGHYGGPGDQPPGSEGAAGEPGTPDGPFQSGGNTAIQGSVDRQTPEFEFVPDIDPPRFGEVPVNDFSFLSNFNFTIDPSSQKKLFFEAADVDDIVLPLGAKYTKPFGQGAAYSYNSLLVPSLGKGAIFYDTSSTEVELVSLNDNIETDNLVAVFNYLEGNVSIPKPENSYDLSNVLNCAATKQLENGAQLIGMQPSDTFADGLGIPYLAGIVRKNNPGVTSNSPSYASSIGSVVKLPDIPAFRDLGYSPSGFTLETWVLVPNLTREKELGWGHDTTNPAHPLQFTRALFSCEGTGLHDRMTNIDHPPGTPGELEPWIDYEERSVDRLYYNKSNSFVRGMVIGFTCDARITKHFSDHGNSLTNNNPEAANGCDFFIAPTISKDKNTCGFIKANSQNGLFRSAESFGNDDLFYKMTISTTSSVDGKSFEQCQDEFSLVTVTVDPSNDLVSMYLDGTLMHKQGIKHTFGSPEGLPPELPSPTLANSFEYLPSSINGPVEMQEGPRLGDYPNWMVGGGFTDGNIFGGGFMGGEPANDGPDDINQTNITSHAGVSSGLRGYVGSTKFYNKALSQTEIEKNYKAQKGFFKNINLTDDNRLLYH